MKFQTVLTARGKECYKGGNVDVMRQMLVSFVARNKLDARRKFDKILCETVGSASEYLYSFKEVL